MAYFAPKTSMMEEEEKKNQMPVLSAAGGGVISPSASGGVPGAKASPQMTQGPTRSGKWVNIQRYLEQNPSMSKMIGQKGQGLLSDESRDYENAAKPLRNASFTPTNFEPWEIAAALEGSNTSERYGDAGEKIPALSKIQEAANQGYYGPKSLDYDENKSGRMTDIKRLTNQQTAMDVLAKPYIEQGRYAPGLRTLDSALMSADPGTSGTIKGIGDRFGSLQKLIGDERPKLESKVKGLQQSGQAARDKVRGGVQSYYDQKTGDLGNEANVRNSDEKRKADAFLKDYTKWYNDLKQSGYDMNRPPDSIGSGGQMYYKDDKGNMVQRGSGANLFSGNWYTPGEKATVDNIGDDQSYMDIGEAAEILGLESPTKKGSFRGGKSEKLPWKQSWDAWFASPEGKKANLGSAMPVLGGQALKDYNQAIANLSKSKSPEEMAKILGLV